MKHNSEKNVVQNQYFKLSTFLTYLLCTKLSFPNSYGTLCTGFLRGSDMPLMASTVMDGNGGTESLLSHQSLSLTSYTTTVLSALNHRFNLNEDLIPSPSDDNNNPVNNSQPSTFFDDNPLPPMFISFLLYSLLLCQHLT